MMPDLWNRFVLEAADSPVPVTRLRDFVMGDVETKAARTSEICAGLLRADLIRVGGRAEGREPFESWRVDHDEVIRRLGQCLREGVERETSDATIVATALGIDVADDVERSATGALTTRILSWVSDDWLPITNVDGFAVDLIRPSRRKALVTATVGEMVKSGLIKLGEVRRGEGFVAWNESADTEIARMTTTYPVNSGDVAGGYSTWLNITEAGLDVERRAQ